MNPVGKCLKDIASYVPRVLRHRKWLDTEAARLEEFRNRHRGEDCFIIGNGPSLKSMQLELLNEYHTFGLNKIYLLFERTGLSTDYHVCVNRFVLEQCRSEFSELTCPSFVSYKHGRKIFGNNKKFFYLGDIHSKWTFFEDLTKGISQGSTVTYVAMQIAFFMGFERVFLIGVDHNFDTRGTPHKVEVLKGDDHSHFDPSYFRGMKWQLPDLEGSEKAYRLARKSFEADNRSIIDATVGGKLTVFPKISFEEALLSARKKKHE